MMSRFRRFRRPLRGMLRRGLRRRPGGRGLIDRLRRAHRAMVNHEFAYAEAEFLALGEEAQLRGLPQGPPLLIASGMAAVEAGDGDRGVEHILRGLQEFRQRGQMRRLALAAGRIIEELRSRGHAAVADRIESQLPESGFQLQAQQQSPAEMLKLPAKCPQCGGSVHPDEVEWANAHSAICDYCGSILPADS